MVTWAVLLVAGALLFVQSLFYLLRGGRRKVITCIFAVLLVLGTLIHAYVLSLSSHTEIDGNLVQIFFLSLVSSLCMFIGHIFVFDDIIAAVIFGRPLLLLAYITVLTLSLSFSFVMVVQVLPRRFRDRMWLRQHQKDASGKHKIHIFLGVSSNAKLLAKAIVRRYGRGGESIIFVDFPQSRGVRTEFGLGDIFSRMTSRREATLEEEIGARRVVILRGVMPESVSSGDFCKAIGLPLLKKFLMSRNTSVYLVGDDFEANKLLLGCFSQNQEYGCKFFCRSNMSGCFETFYQAQKGRIRILNSNALSVSRWKTEDTGLTPINFVDVARDAGGKALGYVKEGIKAFIVGFGDTGQEALKFLYEFSSFVDKDGSPVRNRFCVYDPKIEKVRGEFLNKVPGLIGSDAISWSDHPVGSMGFWNDFRESVESLNYLVISTASADLNVEIAVALLKASARLGKSWDKFVIMAKVNERNPKVEELVSFYNKMYAPDGSKVLRIFGFPDEIWDPDVISGRNLKPAAVAHHDAMQKALGGSETWDERRRRFLAADNKLAARKALMRRQGQEISASLYADTLRRLGAVPPCEGAVLERLCATEHLRYVNYHIAAGYLGGKLDELAQIIPDMVPYKDASPEARMAARAAVETLL